MASWPSSVYDDLGGAWCCVMLGQCWRSCPAGDKSGTMVLLVTLSMTLAIDYGSAYVRSKIL